MAAQHADPLDHFGHPLQGVAEVIKWIGVLSGHLTLPREAPEEEV